MAGLERVPGRVPDAHEPSALDERDAAGIADLEQFRQRAQVGRKVSRIGRSAGSIIHRSVLRRATRVVYSVWPSGRNDAYPVATASWPMSRSSAGAACAPIS